MDRQTIIVRPEQATDYEAIRDITTRAFAPMPFAAGNEQDLIEALRRAGALSHSLVAVQAGCLIGHIAFSPAKSASGTGLWFALGPVAVDPANQGQGIGSRLIHAGLQLLEQEQAAGCILVGDPRYYTRFGFQRFPHLAPEGEPREYFMIRPIAEQSPAEVIAFHSLFHATPQIDEPAT